MESNECNVCNAHLLKYNTYFGTKETFGQQNQVDEEGL